MLAWPYVLRVRCLHVAFKGGLRIGLHRLVAAGVIVSHCVCARTGGRSRADWCRCLVNVVFEHEHMTISYDGQPHPQLLADYVFIHLDPRRPADKLNLLLSMLHKLYSLVRAAATGLLVRMAT